MKDALTWYWLRLDGLRKAKGVKKEWVDDYERLLRATTSLRAYADIENSSLRRRVDEMLNERPGGDL